MDQTVLHVRKGAPGDQPVVGDFDGTGISDIATVNEINSPVAIEGAPAQR